jgi:hypothetical protein
LLRAGSIEDRKTARCESVPKKVSGLRLQDSGRADSVAARQRRPKPYLTTDACNLKPRKSGPSRKPDSALSRHPSPGNPRAPCGAAPTSPWRRVRPTGQFGLLAPVVYLAGPLRGAAGGLLPHPFTHHLCPGEPRPSAGLLSVALDVTEGLRPSIPRVALARAASATSPDFALHPGLKP